MLGKDITMRFSESLNNNIFAIQRSKETKFISKNIKVINLDILDFVSFGQCLKSIAPDIVIHCAAIVNVDYCETKKQSALLLHSEIVELIASNAPLTKFVYVSTDSVFDGEKGDYNVYDKTNPLNYYAKSKLEGELKTLQLFSNPIVARTNIYGFNVPQKSSLAEWGLNNLKESRSFGGFSDVYFNPVYTKQFADSLYQLLINNFSGIINIASDKVVSKFSFLVELAKEFGYNYSIIRSLSVGTVDFKAPRPKNTTLNTSLIADINGNIPEFLQGMRMFREDYINLNPKEGIYAKN